MEIENINLNDDLDIKEVEDMLDNDFLGKKTKTSTKKNNLDNKKTGKTSTKKKKIIDDGDDLSDEDFKL